MPNADDADAEPQDPKILKHLIDQAQCNEIGDGCGEIAMVIIHVRIILEYREKERRREKRERVKE